jgi:hypothetical protein
MSKEMRQHIDNFKNFLTENSKKKLNISDVIHSQIEELENGDEIIIHKPSQKGEGINTPVIFLKYNRWWDWIIVEKDGEELKVSASQDPTEDVIFIEKL